MLSDRVIEGILSVEGDFRQTNGSSFADWLAAHDREVAAKSWDEGALWAAVECGSIDGEANAWLAPGDNPYRTALGVPEEAEHG